MSDEPKKPIRFRFVLFIILSLPIAALGVVLHITQPFHEEPTGDGPVPDEFRHIPYPEILLPPHKAMKIAMDEVRKREGWAGKADDPPIREVRRWYVVVRESGHPEIVRYVDVHAVNGEVLDYRVSE